MWSRQTRSTKQREIDVLIRVISSDLVDRFKNDENASPNEVGRLRDGHFRSRVRLSVRGQANPA